MSIVLQGSTSGSITLQEPAIAGSTVLSLPATSGTILTTGSPASGNVIQVVYGSHSTIATNSTTTYADTGLTATITPKFSNSKILILVSQNGVYPNTNNTGVGLAILRGTSANICQFSRLEGFGSATIFSASASYLDSPATTSATTYKTQFALGQNTGTVTVQNNGDTSTITLMEIAA